MLTIISVLVIVLGALAIGFSGCSQKLSKRIPDYSVIAGLVLVAGGFLALAFLREVHHDFSFATLYLVLGIIAAILAVISLALLRFVRA